MTDMSSRLPSFTSEEMWRGGHYGIEFELGVPSHERLADVMQAIWSHPSLFGCYLSRQQEFQNQIRVEPRKYASEGHLYGTATLPNRLVAACGTYVCRLVHEPERDSRDLVSFYVPLGSISGTYPVGAYPFSDTERAVEWRQELDRWLVDLGRFVFGRVQFQLALIGFEVDFPNVTAAAVQRNGIPAERYDGFMWNVGDRLEWYPPTSFELIRMR